MRQLNHLLVLRDRDSKAERMWLLGKTTMNNQR